MGKLVQDVQVTAEDNFFARSGKKKKADSPRCFFVAGMLAGIARGLLGDRYTCFERACIASGADRCEFLINPRHT
jgi:predicted hydrocarbon binding protein